MNEFFTAVYFFMLFFAPLALFVTPFVIWNHIEERKRRRAVEERERNAMRWL